MGTVKEEENATSESGDNELELMMEPDTLEPDSDMTENVIRQLIEQAKVEGIIPPPSHSNIVMESPDDGELSVILQA